MTWPAVITFLACAHIGAIHSVIFAGFSAESLRDQILACSSRILITADKDYCGCCSVTTKVIADQALNEQGNGHTYIIYVPLTLGTTCVS
ncbi:hypothetical protein BT96DRAFT_1002931 [Gymnopus androsaceus JB14]|uniref:AMP-dependent synthetase/ligase domain-containing protein n=1 Tax=Gymnopus androsaceus JB14 TaxID=1447944 RepID=A0A6A4GVJ8_9AGAR|nr:hypothetical protein BT96DRAFT_1002931 [Gymnopus androsaceus JB14]